MNEIIIQTLFFVYALESVIFSFNTILMDIQAHLYSPFPFLFQTSKSKNIPPPSLYISLFQLIYTL